MSRTRWWPAAVGLLMALAATANAQQLVGGRVKLDGRWDGERLIVTRVKPRDPRRNPLRGTVEGMIAEVDAAAHRVRVGPIWVEWTETTHFAGIAHADLLTGRGVAVEGELIGPRQLRAVSIEAAAAADEVIEVLGAITADHGTSPRGTEIVVLGVPAIIPDGRELRTASLTRNPDDRRPADQLTLGLFNRPLVIGGELSSRVKFEENMALGKKPSDRTRLEEELKTEVFYTLSPTVSIFLESKLSHERDLAASSGLEHDTAFERGQTWLYWTIPNRRLALQLGRQKFHEEREWWWDQDLDGVRLYWDRFPFAAQIAGTYEAGSVTTTGAGIEATDRDIARALGRATWSWSPDHTADLFFLYQADLSAQPAVGTVLDANEEDESDAQLAWVGVRQHGDLESRAGDVDYGVDVAWVHGHETLFDFDDTDGGIETTGRNRRTVGGWAVDGRLTWRPPLPARPAVTLGYAVGSGDDDKTGNTQAFRQTGLQRNNAQFRGVDRFRFYGELLDPELSNLHVFTAALGFPLLESSSIELLYHFYRQDVPAPFLRDTNLHTKPLGKRPELGNEWDIVLGIEEWEHVEIEIVAAFFRAGPAFGAADGELAASGFLKLDYNF